MIIDEIMIKFVHFLSVCGGKIFTPFFRIITFMGEKAWIFLLIAFILCLMKKTRWIGATIILSIALSYVLTDITLKEIIARPRPFETPSSLFYKYWVETGKVPESGYSMPSGHVMGASAFFASLYITSKRSMRKTILIIGFIVVGIMTIARCYFMHHYFTDCIVGFLCAIVVSFIAKFVIKLIHKICVKYSDFILFDFALNFDILSIVSKK